MKDLHLFPTVYRYRLGNSKAAVCLLYLAFSIFVLLVSNLSASAQEEHVPIYFTDFMYISHEEMTMFNEIIWFWNGEFNGPVHTNSAFGLRDPFSFFDWFSQSADEIIGIGEGIHFEFEPHFSAPQLDFPQTLEPIRIRASAQETYFTNNNGNLQTWINADNGGFVLQQWPAGVPYNEEIVEFTTIIPYGLERCIFVEGHLDLCGDHVSGTASIGASGTIRLIDNIMYDDVVGANTPEPGILIDSPNRLLIASEANVLVANTTENGRGNGNTNPGANADHDQKNIIITAHILALGESFSFEHQNDVWDAYRWCDNPVNMQDERGTIYLIGGLSQYRRGYVHRSNCAGTGYEKEYSYDPRWYGDPLPGMTWPYEDAHGTQTWSDTSVTLDENINIHSGDTLTLGPGTEVFFHFGRFTTMDSSGFRIDGAPDNPVILHFEGLDTIPEPVGQNWWTKQQVDGQPFDALKADTTWEHVRINCPNGMAKSLKTPPKLDHIELNAGENRFGLQLGNWDEPEIANSEFHADMIYLTGQSSETIIPDFKANRSLFRAKLVVGSHLDYFDEAFTTFASAELDHCVIHALNSVSEDDPLIHYIAPGLLSNSYLKANSVGTGIESSEPVTVSYTAYYPNFNLLLDGEQITEGPGVFAAEGHFVDEQNGDYHLLETSQLIDAGDPGSPLDPDGTRSDIGIYPYMQENGIEGGDKELPSEFSVSAPSPNPFNNRTKLIISLPYDTEVKVSVVNALGRLVRTYPERKMTAGFVVLDIDGDSLASGVYYIAVQSGLGTSVQKAVLIK